MKKSHISWLFALVALVLSSSADAGYSNLFVFGDSLSDSGNNEFVLKGVTPVPISGNNFIPTYPYASGHYTNNQVWAQTLASSLGLSAAPSLLGGTDYAFGGARTGPLSFTTYPPSLETQAATFLLQYENVAPSNALYVVAGGGNDARDALNAIGGCSGNASCINDIFSSTAAIYGTYIEKTVTKLESVGARNIVVWTVPDVGVTPAILASGASALGSLLASTMNSTLVNDLSKLNVDIFNLFGLMDNIVGNPGDFGLTNVTDACAQFVTCDPSKYLFWDGIHPTSAGQQIISNAMLESVSVPEPVTLALLASGLFGFSATRRKANHA
jgi:outer membrane lipase/esterase